MVRGGGGITSPTSYHDLRVSGTDPAEGQTEEGQPLKPTEPLGPSSSEYASQRGGVPLPAD